MLAVIQALVMKRTFAGVQYDLLFVKPGVATMPYTRHYYLRRYAKDYFANDCCVYNLQEWFDCSYTYLIFITC